MILLHTLKPGSSAPGDTLVFNASCFVLIVMPVIDPSWKLNFLPEADAGHISNVGFA